MRYAVVAAMANVAAIKSPSITPKTLKLLLVREGDTVAATALTAFASFAVGASCAVGTTILFKCVKQRHVATFSAELEVMGTPRLASTS